MEYAMVVVPAAPVRRRSRHAVEMVNQLLFGESVRILKEKDGRWVKVQSLHDGYEGWMTSNMLRAITQEEAEERRQFCSMELLAPMQFEGALMQIPQGSLLPGYDEESRMFASAKNLFPGKVAARNPSAHAPDLLGELTRPWLNAPYMWGGRTILGVDCSGFTQIIYRLMGIDLPRDAWQQAQEGREVGKISKAKTGDLLFFNEKEEIIHVGIYLGAEQMVHASGRVRIDTITQKGWVDPANAKRKLKLRAIRRLMS